MVGRGSPGTRTRNLELKRLLLLPIELATRGEFSGRPSSPEPGGPGRCALVDVSVATVTMPCMTATRQCPRCHAQLPLSAFAFRDRAHTKIQSYCRACSAAAWRDWYGTEANRARHLRLVASRRRRRIEHVRAWLVDLKDTPCADCGRRFPPEAMDFDHLEGKRGNVSRMAHSVGMDALRKEVDKCEVVCATCHRIRTAARRA